jgi:small-conductance mechanosensitive channel
VLTWVAAVVLRRIVRTLLRRSRIRPSLQQLSVTLVQTMVWIGGILIAITIIFPSLTPAKLLAALGLGSIAVGLAFKDIFENFIAGMMIMLRKPMRIGDFIECEGITGKVEDITIRDTYIRKTDDQLVMLPNAFVYKNPVYVITDRTLRRHEIVCGVAYDVDLDAAKKVIQETMEGIEGIETSRGIDVFAREFNSSSMDFTVRWWAASRPRGMHESRDLVVRAIKRALDDAGMEIPFPYRTLTFKDPLSLRSKEKLLPEDADTGGTGREPAGD